MFIKLKNKKSFLTIELIFVITILSIISFYIIPKDSSDKLEIAVNRLELYLNITRLKAMSDNKYEENNPLWHKKRWTLKFLNCRSSVGGIYYVIYSDNNMSGHPSLEDSLLDPMTKKYIYSNNYCNYDEKISPFILLTKEFDIVNVDISCNSTTSLGQISFGYDGNVYTKLSSNEYEFYDYVLENECILKFKNSKGREKALKINPKTGMIEKK